MTKEKGGFLTPKAIANRIKAKGLQKLRWYCQMCQKQCRDENGYKCHTMSEAHHRQMKLFAENGGKFISSYSSEFLKGYLDILRRQFGGKRVHANDVYQEYIRDKEHIHMNATRWHTLTGLCLWLGKQGICRVDETERGWYLEYIDRDPEKEKRQECNDRLEKTEDEINRKLLERQMELNLARVQEVDGPVHTPLVRTEEPIRLDLKLAPRKGFTPVLVSEGAQEQPADKPSGNKLMTLGVKKAKANNPLLEAEKKAREGKKSVKVDAQPDITSGKRNALTQLMEKEEAWKDKRSRKKHWLTEGIEVKLVSRKLSENVRLRHADVVKMVDKYTAIVNVHGTSTRIKVDQDHVQTVVPHESSTAIVVNGAYRGEYATVENVDKDAATCDITIVTGLCMGRSIKQMSMEDVCKLTETF